jgi:hypothetical protein
MSGRSKISLSILDFSHLYLDFPKFPFRSSIFLIYVWTSQKSTFYPRFFYLCLDVPKFPFGLSIFLIYVWTSQSSPLEPQFFSFMSGRSKISLSIRDFFIYVWTFQNFPFDARFFSFMSGSPKFPLSILDFSHLCLDVPKFHFLSSILHIINYIVCICHSFSTVTCLGSKAKHLPPLFQ